MPFYERIPHSEVEVGKGWRILKQSSKTDVIKQYWIKAIGLLPYFVSITPPFSYVYTRSEMSWGAPNRPSK